MSKMTKIGVLFSGKLAAVYGASIGLICGIFYAFGGFFYELFTANLNAGTVMAFGALIGMPILFAINGFVTGLIGAVFYNFVARRLGGLKADFELDR